MSNRNKQKKSKNNARRKNAQSRPAKSRAAAQAHQNRKQLLADRGAIRDTREFSKLSQAVRAGKALDPAALAYLRLNDNIFKAPLTHEGQLIIPPVAGGDAPCILNSVVTYGSVDITVAAGATTEIAFNPEGLVVDGERTLRTSTVNGSLGIMGPLATSGGAVPTCAIIRSGASALGRFWDTATLTTATKVALPWDNNEPAQFTSSVTDEQFGVTAFGTSIEYKGKFLDRNGTVRTYQTYEYPKASANLTSTRNNGLYKEEKFESMTRAGAFRDMMVPNCETNKPLQNNASDASVTTGSAVRYVRTITNDDPSASHTYTVRCLAVYNYEIARYAPSGKAQKISPNANIVKSAFAEKAHSGTSLVQAAIEHHASAHPILTEFGDLAKDVFAVAKAAAPPSARIMSHALQKMFM